MVRFRLTRMYSPAAAIILAIVAISANPATAQSVRIQNGLGEWGFGWMFAHSGNCYVAMPSHVAGPLPKVTVATASPVVSDQAKVIKPFWEGIDLAIGVVDRGVIDGRCIARLDDLDATAYTRTAPQALLLRISPLGEEERLPLRLLDRNYLSFVGEVTRDGDAIGQGTSGAFAFAEGKPIGMAITSDDPSRAYFMRSEEIALNLGRYLNQQGGAFVAPLPTGDDDADAAAELGPALPVKVHSSNLRPVLPQHAPENLFGPGLFIFRPTGPLEIVLKTADGNLAAISRLRLAAPADSGHVLPKDVIVYLDHTEAGQRFRFWTEGQMRPDGTFDTGPLQPRNTRWIKILVKSYWGEGETAAIDTVRVD